MKKRLNILHVAVDAIDMSEAIHRIDGFIKHGNRPHAVFAVNPEKALTVQKDKKLRKMLKETDLLIPDGIGIVLAVKILCGISIDRLPGVDLMEKICQLSSRKGYKIFLYGAQEKVNKTAVKVLRNRYKNLKIVGRANGYIKVEAMTTLIDNINRTKADILLLALGSPKQEKWFQNNQHLLRHVKVCQGIGGTLDTIAGNVKRAPKNWQDLSLEWLYRLIKEPKRINRQKILPLFVVAVFIERIKTILTR